MMTSTFWTFHAAGQLVFGSGAVRRLGRLVSELDLKRVWIVTDETLAGIGALERVSRPLAEAGVALQAFTGGEPEPSLRVAEACRDKARTFGPDAILGLGGGSNMDLAKTVAVLLTHGGQVRDYFGSDKVPGPVLPIVCVPTTAGTGSEVSGSAVLTDAENEMKVSSLSSHLRPRLAVVDPELTLSCPRHVTAESGIDALTHAIEAYTAFDNAALGLTPDATELPPYFGRHPLGECLAEKAIELVGRHLVAAVDEPANLQAREGMALAATLAGMAFSNCGVALVHALEYPVGGATHCSHGAGNGLFLPYVMRFNLPERRQALARVAELLGEDVRGLDPATAAERAIEAVERLRRAIGIPERLRDLGASEDQLPTFAAKAFQIKRLLTVNPRMPSEQDLLAILQAAF